MNIDKMRAATERRSAFEASPMPEVFSSVPAGFVTDVDVRDDLKRGEEPFARIMGAQAAVPAGGVLRVRAIFEPVPLYMVLGRQGFTHWTERLADDDWRVWFYRGDVSATREMPQVVASADAAESNNLVVIDVRGLEPPEPMTRTLEELERLPEGQELLQINVRVPQFLLPVLDDRGFEYVLVSEKPGEVRGLIRRKSTNMEKKVDNAASRELDVRVIPPREKHPAIFKTFDALAPGSDFILVNDHDPFPLRYQFEAERANRFTWDYLEKGPVVWRVRIGRTA